MPVLEVLLSRRRLAPDMDDHIESILSTCPRDLNQKLAEWVDSARKDANAYDTFRKNSWYVYEGKTKSGDPCLMSGKDILDFKVIFKPPPPLPDKFNSDMAKEYDAHYFSSYNTAWQVVVNFHTTLTHVCSLEAAKTFRLIKVEEFICSRLERMRLRYRMSEDQELRDKLHANIRSLTLPLQAVQKEIRRRNA